MGGGGRNATEEVTWMSKKMFLPLKSLCPDEQFQLSGNWINVSNELEKSYSIIFQLKCLL